MFVYVGAYTEPPAGNGEGIYVFRFDPESGGLEPVLTVREVANASFLALSGDGRYLYAVNELDKGGVSAFGRDTGSGELSPLNWQASHGASPCYISLDARGRFALVANYTSGTIAALPVAEDGSLDAASSVIQHEGSSVDPKRQDGPHAHMIAPTPDGRFVLATDLGTDQIMIYQLDVESGRLVPNEDGPASVSAEPGAGPRHFAFGADGRTLYVINELSSTLSVYGYDGRTGELKPRQTVSSLPEGFDGKNTCAQVVVSPDGRFVYGSNRGHNSIAIWAIADGGEVSLAGHEPTQGTDPRNFAIDPGSQWLLAANQRSNTIVHFRRNPDSGLLKATGQVTQVPTPVAIVFSPD
jgi:6-phosphogluconolactonase